MLLLIGTQPYENYFHQLIAQNFNFKYMKMGNNGRKTRKKENINSNDKL